jgi:glucose dehydrogenase
VSARSKQLVRHYVEMVVAMFLGMFVLGAPAVWALTAVGIDYNRLSDDSPALMFLGMAMTMTVPMVGWMRDRGHGPRANAEMSASMFLPTFAVIGLLWADLVTDLGTLMVVEHVAMLAAMAGVMIARPAEYAHHHHAGGEDGAIAGQVPA